MNSKSNTPISDELFKYMEESAKRKAKLLEEFKEAMRKFEITNEYFRREAERRGEYK